MNEEERRLEVTVVNSKNHIVEALFYDRITNLRPWYSTPDQWKVKDGRVTYINSSMEIEDYKNYNHTY